LDSGKRSGKVRAVVRRSPFSSALPGHPNPSKAACTVLYQSYSFARYTLTPIPTTSQTTPPHQTPPLSAASASQQPCEHLRRVPGPSTAPRAREVSGNSTSETTPRRQQRALPPAIQLLAHERHHHEVRPNVGPGSEVALGYDASVSASSLVKRSYVKHRNALKHLHRP